MHVGSKHIFLALYTAVAIGFNGSVAYAKSVNLSSSCTSTDGKTIKGLRTETLYPIASVSKIFTSYWALKTYGVDHRFITKVHLAKVEGEWQAHIEGSYDPYFSKKSIQYLAATLNKKGIYKLSRLTFDGRVFLALNITDSELISDTYENTHPSRVKTGDNLVQIFTRLNRGYETLRSQVEQAHGELLPDTINLTVEEIAYLNANSFKPKGKTVVLLPSVPLIGMIKYMNTHSHNYLSEALYQGLGNGSDLENFLHSELGISVADISFLNGSGNNDGENRYTRANCKSIIKTIYALRKLMIESGKKSYHAMGVVDVDLETGKGYRSEYTSDSVVAKTGTVAKAVTLAGIASTQQGNVYFAFIYKTPSIAYAGQARRAIKEDLIELIDQHGGPEKMDSNSPEGYDPFDRKNVVIITQENLDSVPLRQN